MGGDPARDVHADGADFGQLAILVPHPDSGCAGFPAALNSEARQGPDHRFLQAPDVGHDIAFPFSQIDNRVADNLAGAVVSDVAAAVDLEEFDAQLGQAVAAEQHVFQAAVAAQGQHMRMFEQQELVTDFAGFAAGLQGLLQGPGVGEGDAAEFAQL